MSGTGTAPAADSVAVATQQDHDARVTAKAADDDVDGAMSETESTSKNVYRLPNGKLYSKECEYDQHGRDLRWPHWTHGMKRFATEGGIWLFSTLVWAFMLVYGAQAASASSTGCLYVAGRCELGQTGGSASSVDCLSTVRGGFPVADCLQVTFHPVPVVIALTAIIVMELLIAAGCAGSRLWNPEHEDKWFTTSAWWDVAWACGLAASAAAMLVILAVIA